MMSATADISRYREYFKDLGRDERVEVLAIPSSGQHINFQRKVLYLEQVINFNYAHKINGNIIVFLIVFFFFLVSSDIPLGVSDYAWHA